MIKYILTIFGLTIFFFISIVAISSFSPSTAITAYANSSGSPGSRSGSPGDISSCNVCHTGTINPGSASTSIVSSGLLSGYTPGQTYTMTVGITGTSSNKIGFEATAERDIDNTKTGTLIITDAARTKTTNFGDAVTHNSTAGSSATGGANSWSFDWTAPAPGTGDVTIYASINATNGNGSTSGDQVYTVSFSVFEGGVGINEFSSINDIQLYPNPANSFFNIVGYEGLNQIKIINLTGQTVKEINNPESFIKVENFVKGLYFIELVKGKESTTKRLIIQ